MLTSYSAKKKWLRLQNNQGWLNRRSYLKAANDAREFAKVVVTCDSRFCQLYNTQHSSCVVKHRPNQEVKMMTIILLWNLSNAQS